MGVRVWQCHQTLAIGADVGDNVIDRTVIPGHLPLQGRSRNVGRDAYTVIDARFNFRRLLVVIPCDQLERFELTSRVVKRVKFRKCLQPCLSALLAHDAIGSPRCEGVIKSFVRRSDRFLVLKRHPGVIEAGQIAHAKIRSRRHDPRVASLAQHVGESVVVLEKECRLGRQCLRYFLPIDRIRLIDIEIRDHWLPLQRHIGLGRKVCLLDVLQLTDECLLRRAS